MSAYLSLFVCFDNNSERDQFAREIRNMQRFARHHFIK